MSSFICWKVLKNSIFFWAKHELIKWPLQMRRFSDCLDVAICCLPSSQTLYKRVLVFLLFFLFSLSLSLSLARSLPCQRTFQFTLCALVSVKRGAQTETSVCTLVVANTVSSELCQAACKPRLTSNRPYGTRESENKPLSSLVTLSETFVCN